MSARVGSGYSDQQLLKLLSKLEQHWNKWNKKSPPANIKCAKETPEVI